jgi:subtilisin family serine protease
MLNTLTRWLLASILIFGTVTINTVAYATPGEQRWVPGQILVAPRTGVGPADFEAMLQRHGGRSKGRLGPLDVHVVEVPGHAEAAVAAALAHNPGIRFAELDILVKPDITSANDEHYLDAWHLATINAPTAWDSSQGNGVTVAILDTGVDASHPDLQGQLVPGWNMYDNNPDTSDVHGHGTLISGIVAARSNNTIGVTSIAWSAKLLPVRISGPDGWAPFSTIASGLTWAADNGAKVANISYAVSGSSTVTSAAEYMRSKGGVVCAAAGNNGSQLSIAPNPSIITVSATNSSDVLPSWSNYGSVIDVAAPGAGIWSTKRGGSYAAVSGTSASTPATAAVAALVVAHNPSLSSAQVENILMSSAVDLGAPGQDDFFGHGRIDAAAAVAAAGEGGSGGGSDTTAPIIAITSPTGGTVTGVASVALNASDDTAVTRVELFVDGAPVGTDSTAPFTISWDSSGHANGAAELRAYAYDAENNRGTSQAVSVTVDNQVVADTSPPAVFILSPSATTTVSGTVNIQISAQDNIGIALVKCYVGGVLKGTTTADTLSCSWNTRKATVGLHTIRAYAEDTAGLTAITETQVEVVSTTKGGGSKDGGDKGGGGGKGRKK